MAKRRWLLVPAILVLAFGCVQIIGVEPGTLRGTAGGGGGTSSSSGTTSTSNTCAVESCSVAATCPAPPLCFTRACESGCCTAHYTTFGDSCDGASIGTCDGSGDCTCYFDSECPELDCQIATCSGTPTTSGYCNYSPASNQTPCLSGVGLCNGDGGCSQ
jgi:hypothetical protein